MERHEVISQTLGFPGRMISGSKSGYHKNYPNNLVIFNANVCTDRNKIWYGDLDLTLDKEKLSLLAVALGQDLYVLYEMDGRFENEKAPILKAASVIFKADGTWEIGQGSRYESLDAETLTINN
jgi:hypothetical protein